MQRLGYEPDAVESEEDRIDFTEDLVQEYTAENKRLIEKMNADLAIENPDDLNRRKIQAAVLENTTTEHYDEEFVKRSNTFDIDDALDLLGLRSSMVAEVRPTSSQMLIIVLIRWSQLLRLPPPLWISVLTLYMLLHRCSQHMFRR